MSTQPPFRKTSLSVGALLIIVLSASVVVGQKNSEQVDVANDEAKPALFLNAFTIRARLTEIRPVEPTEILWRYGGEGLGGNVVRGRFRKMGISDSGDHRLALGEWSDWLSVDDLLTRKTPQKFFLTVTAGNSGRIIDRVSRRREGYSTDVVFEFQFCWCDKVIKTIKESGPDGGTVTLVIPFYRLGVETTPADAPFLDEVTGVLAYARRRANYLESLPWAGGPLPHRFAIVNNAGGYGSAFGYGVRHTHPDVTRAELRSLRQLGVNGFRDPADNLSTILAGDATWSRASLIHVMGFPTPSYREGRKNDPEAGCPFGEGVGQRTEEAVARSLQTALAVPVDQVWGLTMDEIGTVVDRSAEGKAHLSVCPRCTRGFQTWLQSKGLRPTDFGKSSWEDVRPLDVWDAGSDRPWLEDSGVALAAYYTRDFNNYVTARMFTPLRDAFWRANQQKRDALTRGDHDSLLARQPWLYSFALRGNTFLMKGHSLDFFDFYRSADNAIVYETSNRGPQVWSWDSYLCDVQRVVAESLNINKGIYIKPHRGAPIQRMLSAVSRGNTMLYWYTYGPDYAKGDSFSQSDDALALTSKAAHLLGKAEDWLYGSTWAVPAEVAVVKPETTQRWMNLCGDPPHLMAAWENAKWIYTALQHAHLPVDPIDERMLAEDDLSRYKIIYVSGSHVTGAAARGLLRFVQAGGTIYTSGWGLARDEANRPLELLHPVLGLNERRDPQMWYRVRLYGATDIESYDDPRHVLGTVPEKARITGSADFAGTIKPVIGREVLSPNHAADILAQFADGNAAVTRHRFGDGFAYVAGFFPGLEYSSTVRRTDFDMAHDFAATSRQFIAAPALRLTRPIVDASHPLVEGVLLRNRENGKRCATLANWTYAVTAMQEDARGRPSPTVRHVPLANLTITIQGAGRVQTIRSCQLDRDLEFSRDVDKIVVALPRLEEGDVLLLD